MKKQLSLIIASIGISCTHNSFPKIINSDERQWSWVDEVLNSFVEYLTEELFDNKSLFQKGRPGPLPTI